MPHADYYDLTDRWPANCVARVFRKCIVSYRISRASQLHTVWRQCPWAGYRTICVPSHEHLRGHPQCRFVLCVFAGSATGHGRHRREGNPEGLWQKIPHNLRRPFGVCLCTSIALITSKDITLIRVSVGGRGPSSRCLQRHLLYRQSAGHLATVHERHRVKHVLGMSSCFHVWTLPRSVLPTVRITCSMHLKRLLKRSCLVGQVYRSFLCIVCQRGWACW